MWDTFRSEQNTLTEKDTSLLSKLAVLVKISKYERPTFMQYCLLRQKHPHLPLSVETVRSLHSQATALQKNCQSSEFPLTAIWSNRCSLQGTMKDTEGLKLVTANLIKAKSSHVHTCLRLPSQLRFQHYS